MSQNITSDILKGLGLCGGLLIGWKAIDEIATFQTPPEVRKAKIEADDNEQCRQHCYDAFMNKDRTIFPTNSIHSAVEYRFIQPMNANDKDCLLKCFAQCNKNRNQQQQQE